MIKFSKLMIEKTFQLEDEKQLFIDVSIVLGIIWMRKILFLFSQELLAKRFSRKIKLIILCQKTRLIFPNVNVQFL